MPIKLRRVYLDTIRERYKNAPKSIKQIILNEFCQVCGYSRKYAIRILNRQIEPRVNRPGPKPKYGPVVVNHLRTLWLAMNKMCSKKMVVAIPLWLEFYKDADKTIKDQLNQMSASTIDRYLKPFKQPLNKGISTTSPSMIKNRIPIKLLDEEVKEPGFVESDTVAHCGDSASGPFNSSLTVTDLYSAWTENRALGAKTAEQVMIQLKKIEEGLPFMLLGFASDSGSEFINEQLETHLKNRLKPVEFVRRRPYKKNDNAHVEQKNWTHVRELFGYQRFDHPDDIAKMNEIYQAYWNPLWNYFTPVMKLKKKTRIGGRLIKEYDEPKTPMQRLLESPHLPNHQKRALKENFSLKNPFYLKEQLDKKLKEFFESVDKRSSKLTGS